MDRSYRYTLGIDIGSTTTSISYSKTPLYEELHSIESWPGDIKCTTGVYSSFLYNQTTRESFWGYEAFENSTKAEHEVYISHIFDVFDKKKYKSEELSIFYLSKFIEGVVNYAFEKMKASYSSSDSQVKESTYFIVTCPDQPEKTCPQFKDWMKEAFKTAGLVEKDDEIEQRLDFIDNSAAVGYHCLRQTTHNQNPEMHLKPNKNYLVYNINNSVGVAAIFAESQDVSVTISSIVDNEIKALGSQEILNALRENSRPTEYFLDDLSEDLFNDLRFYADIDPSSREHYYLLRRVFHEHYYTFGFRVVRFRQPKPVNQKLKKIIDRLVDSVTRIKQKLKDIPIEKIYIYGGFGQNRTLLDALRRNHNAATPVYNYEHAASIGAVTFGKLRLQSLIFPRMDASQVSQDPATSPQETKKEDDVKETEVGQPISSVDKESNISETSESTNKVEESISEEHSEKGKEEKAKHYFIGIDFGTTYSGAAYAVKEGTEKGKRSVIDIKNWPSQRGNNYPKAPTVILYNEDRDYIDKWGEAAKRMYTSPKNNASMIRNFKLLLTEKIQEPDQAKHFKPMQLIPEYLTSFHAHILKEIHNVDKNFDEDNVTYCFTVPSMWGEMAKQIFVDAIILSGIINRDEIDKRLRLISEPEAAALYCEQNFQDQFQMSKGQRFLICDAGGGTVDVVTFEVNQKTNKKYLAERTGGDGKNCGSIALDLHFEQYIMDVFKQNNIPLKATAIEELVQKFVTEVKPNFNYAHDPINFSIEFELPSSLKISDETMENSELFVDGLLCIPYEDMCKSIFDPVVSQTVDLIAQHLEKLPEESRQVDAMLLVGGFGQSAYLHHKVQERFLNKYTQFVGVPPEGEMAVARGAVYFCLNPEMMNHRPSRHTYGLGYSNVPEDKSKVIEKGFNAKDAIALRFLPFAERKVSIFEDLVKAKQVYFTYPCHGEIHIFSSNTDSAPLYVTHARQLWVYPLDLTKIPKKKKGDKIQITVTMRIGRTLTTVEVTGEDIYRPISKILVDYSPGRIADVVKSDAKVSKFVIQKGVIREI